MSAPRLQHAITVSLVSTAPPHAIAYPEQDATMSLATVPMIYVRLGGPKVIVALVRCIIQLHNLLVYGDRINVCVFITCEENVNCHFRAYV